MHFLKYQIYIVHVANKGAIKIRIIWQFKTITVLDIRGIYHVAITWISFELVFMGIFGKTLYWSYPTVFNELWNATFYIIFTQLD